VRLHVYLSQFYKLLFDSAVNQTYNGPLQSTGVADWVDDKEILNHTLHFMISTDSKKMAFTLGNYVCNPLSFVQTWLLPQMFSETVTRQFHVFGQQLSLSLAAKNLTVPKLAAKNLTVPKLAAKNLTVQYRSWLRTIWQYRAKNLIVQYRSLSKFTEVSNIKLNLHSLSMPCDSMKLKRTFLILYPPSLTRTGLQF
jgi:hypothetical protein